MTSALEMCIRLKDELEFLRKKNKESVKQEDELEFICIENNCKNCFKHEKFICAENVCKICDKLKYHIVN